MLPAGAPLPPPPAACSPRRICRWNPTPAGRSQDSFGNATRIDYGTGHEATFAAALLCFAKAGAFGEADRQAPSLAVLARSKPPVVSGCVAHDA